jgi:hypothetical protein
MLEILKRIELTQETHGSKMAGFGRRSAVECSPAED